MRRPPRIGNIAMTLHISAPAAKIAADASPPTVRAHGSIPRAVRPAFGQFAGIAATRNAGTLRTPPRRPTPASSPPRRASVGRADRRAAAP